MSLKYDLIRSAVDLVEEFEKSNSGNFYPNNIDGFKSWVSDTQASATTEQNISWEGKENGRSAESVINTLLVKMNRFAKNYSKSAILGSEFSTQEDFIYLISLKAFGKMSKMELIKKNVHEKPVGMLIINRLMDKGWIMQEDSPTDKRSKIISINEKGLVELANQMGKIRMATNIVCGNLSDTEKMELIKLLSKLHDYHMKIYERNFDLEKLLEEASSFPD